MSESETINLSPPDAPLDLYYGAADSEAAHLNGRNVGGVFASQLADMLQQLSAQAGDDTAICPKCFWAEVSAWAMARAQHEGAALNLPMRIMQRAQALANEGREDARN